jgi:hypothetical protein
MLAVIKDLKDMLAFLRRRGARGHCRRSRHVAGVGDVEGDGAERNDGAMAAASARQPVPACPLPRG